MGAVTRGVRNLARNPTRSLLVTTLIALSVAVMVATAAAGPASGQRAETLRSETATQILVQGSPGGGGSGVLPLPASLEAQLTSIEGVAEVDVYLRRPFSDNTQQVAMGVFTGARPRSELRLASMGSFTGTPRLVAGRTLRPADADRPVAVVGQVFADQNDLQVGSSFTLPARLLAGPGQARGGTADLEAQVVGIYSVEVASGDNQLFVPLSVAQTVLGQSEQVTQFWVQAQSADQVPAVEQRLKRLLSRQQIEGAYVAASSEQARAAAASLDAVGANATLAAGVAALAGGVVVGAAMVLVTRERRREIAVLKALGASNRHVAAQFVAESVALAALGGLLGAGLAVAAAPSLAQVFLGGADQLSALQVDGAAAAAGVGLAVVFGVLGSLYPVRRGLRLQPAEALRPLE